MCIHVDLQAGLIERLIEELVIAEKLQNNGGHGTVY